MPRRGQMYVTGTACMRPCRGAKRAVIKALFCPAELLPWRRSDRSLSCCGRKRDWTGSTQGSIQTPLRQRGDSIIREHSV